MSTLRFYLEQIQFARTYTLRLLNNIDPNDWFRMPSEGVTHIAWQVGHLAYAEYRLALRLMRGEQPDDESLLPKQFWILFGRESKPEVDPAKNPPVEEILQVLATVHEATFRELLALPDLDLDSAPLYSHSLSQTKGEVLRWCSHHEMIHAGQIGLLRRLFGASPLW